ncbi:three-helix bundle dimerization domain-containing protein [Actinomadura terrae]|uniref:three-helix bundle dimerization domain-containing protein n=1 Tax=Actinomadura terrae TaxID=604353 RepID=UPI003558249E
MSTQGDPAVREAQALKEVTDRLRRSFGDSYSEHQVTETVTAVLHRFDDRPIRDFVPILVERMARERLGAADSLGPADTL